MTWIDIILPFICMGAVTADELWSEWYGRLSGTTHLIESSLDGDSIETVCVGTTHVIETSLDYVSAIKATFASGTVSGWFGGSNDTESCFTLSTDEYIVSVLVKAGAIIDAVQFTSSLGNTYGPYGGVGGTPYTVSGPDFEALLKMEVVAGAWRDGTYITQMRFYFDDQSSSAQLTPTDYDVDDISVVFGGQCDVSDGGWFLSAHTTETIVDWAIEVDLSGDYDLSDGMSSIAFTIDGEKVNNQGDIFMGFGDGAKYISFLTDFDGGVNNKDTVRGIQVYPKCADGNGNLGVGDVSDILSNTNSYNDDNEYAVRFALADGSLENWEELGGTTVHNGATWPVTIEIVNDMDANEVTFRFSSNTTTAECTYSDSFGAGGFVYGILPDTEDGDADDFHIYSIGISQTADASSASVDHLAHFDGIGTLNQVSMDTITVTVTAKDLFILLLVIANVFTLTMLVCQCRNRWNGMGNKVKYEAVNVLSENEILQQ